MGVRSLETFLRKAVPNGFFEINIEDEIRKYYENSAKPNPPAPIIVIDLMAMNQAMCQIDVDGQICGGRLKVAYAQMDRFFARLIGCGAKLEFICDGALPQIKYGKWCERQNQSYERMIECYDKIDRGCSIPDLLMWDGVLITHGGYPLKQLAKKHGRLTISFEVECDQMVAAFATNENALAILSNDTDYLIYAGNWHLWSSKDINFETLNTLEYNRQGLLNVLQLNYRQMRLFATLAGNHVIAHSELENFHSKLGKPWQKFHNLAYFVRQCPENLYRADVLRQLLTRVFGRSAVNRDLIGRCQHSLNSYETNRRSPNLNPTEDKVMDILLKQDNSFPFTAWLGKAKDVSTCFIDLRAENFGTHFPQMIVSMLSRQAGITLYHRRTQRQIADFSRFNLLIKLSHDVGFSLQQHRAEFPQHIEPPSLVDLLSREPEIRSRLLETKLRLYCWIASDTLDHLRLQPIPEELRVLVVTLYCLVENQLMAPFEADLLLQVAYDVINETYDYRKVESPLQLNGRAFRITFLFLCVYNEFQDAFKGLGLDGEKFNDYPPFDGMLFQIRYEDWSQQKSNLDKIKNWRIYEGLVRRN